MQLTITEQIDSLLAQSTSPTVVEPGQSFSVAVTLISETAVTLQSVEVAIPEDVELVSNPIPELMPYALEPGKRLTFELGFETSRQHETFGLIRAVASFSTAAAPDEPIQLAWENWLSVFTRVVASYPQPLADALVQRLIAVANHTLRNAHIFMADFVAYFDDYLNIDIPAEAVAGITDMLPFATDGLPLDAETRLAIAQGRKTFYGITDWQFEAEDECEEFDDVFQPSGTTDVEPVEVEV